MGSFRLVYCQRRGVRDIKPQQNLQFPAPAGLVWEGSVVYVSKNLHHKSYNFSTLYGMPEFVWERCVYTIHHVQSKAGGADPGEGADLYGRQGLFRQ